MDSETRSMEIASNEDELLESNRSIWKSLGFRQSDNALFFPAPNALVPIMFARFMNKRKVTFADTNEISVSTLIKLSAQLKLSNVTVKLASPTGKLPLADSSFDVVYSDWGLSHFASETGRAADSDALARELVRVVKDGGKLVALEDNGAPVMYPCPQEILSIRTKIESPRAERLIMGRKIYSIFKANNLKHIQLKAYANFLTGEDRERMGAELKRRVAFLESAKESHTLTGVTLQEVERYRSWLKAQLTNDSFLMQFNSILAIGEK
ncbi:MAG: methyltransferase domain-containing protein [Nitrososphaerota archaeon]|nr:methyltransferase domain-containing protein [Nitrososphaerota archaeon]